VGYAPTAYVVDLAALRAMFGCHDPKLAGKIVKKHAADVADKDAWFADDIANGAPDVATALAEIIAGKCTKKQHGFQYAYALELACKHLGTSLYAADWINAGFLDALQAALPKGAVKKLLTANHVTENPRPVVRIPLPKDFPGMGYFESAQCKEALAVLKAVKLDPDARYGDFDGEDLAEGLAELRGWFHKAVAKKRGLMVFTY
jgi:hypothetical protein